MRDDRAGPVDRGAGRRDEATTGATKGSALPQADGTPADFRSDAPAVLQGPFQLADAEEPGLTDEEIAMYRRRVAEGMYNTREVAEEVARRMMRRGDI